MRYWIDASIFGFVYIGHTGDLVKMGKAVFFNFDIYA